MGQNLDDANTYYKQQWAREMMPLFGPQRDKFLRIDQSNDRRGPDESAGASRKIQNESGVRAKGGRPNRAHSTGGCPRRMRFIGRALGLERAKENPDKVKSDDLITLRRNIYQYMLQAFHHGRIIDDPFAKLLAGAEPGPGRQGQRRLCDADARTSNTATTSATPREFSERRGLFSLRKQPRGRRRPVV